MKGEKSVQPRRDSYSPIEVCPVEVKNKKTYFPTRILWMQGRPIIAILTNPTETIYISTLAGKPKELSINSLKSVISIQQGQTAIRPVTKEIPLLEGQPYLEIALKALKAITPDQNEQASLLPPEALEGLQALEEQIQLSLASQRLQQALGIYYVEPGSQTPQILNLKFLQNLKNIIKRYPPKNSPTIITPDLNFPPKQ